MYLQENARLIARLDIKGANLIKGIHLEGQRIIGNPNEFALQYYLQGIDELILMDSVASLYNRNALLEILKKSVENIFIPITIGGGIRSYEEAVEIFRSGADKIAINTAAITNPDLIYKIANAFGSQSVVLSIEAKKMGYHKWQAYTHNGRQPSGIDVIEWAKQSENSGAGEILLTSIDQEGTQKGFDIELLQAVSSEVNIPVIASGGFGNLSDLFKAFKYGHVDAVAIAGSLHYKRVTISELRKKLVESGLKTRLITC